MILDVPSKTIPPGSRRANAEPTPWMNAGDKATFSTPAGYAKRFVVSEPGVYVLYATPQDDFVLVLQELNGIHRLLEMLG